MGSRLRVLVAVTIVLTALSPAHPGSAASHTPSGDLAFVEHHLYVLPIGAFIGAADRGVSPAGDRWYDWSTDGCSAPRVGDTGRSFDFRAPCRRHDFGYRNLRLLEHRWGTGTTFWNRSARERVDRQFLADMRAHCHVRRWFDRPTCLAWANVYFAAVRVAGGP